MTPCLRFPKLSEKLVHQRRIVQRCKVFVAAPNRIELLSEPLDGLRGLGLGCCGLKLGVRCVELSVCGLELRVCTGW